MRQAEEGNCGHRVAGDHEKQTGQRSIEPIAQRRGWTSHLEKQRAAESEQKMPLVGLWRICSADSIVQQQECWAGKGKEAEWQKGWLETGRWQSQAEQGLAGKSRGRVGLGVLDTRNTEALGSFGVDTAEQKQAGPGEEVLGRAVPKPGLGKGVLGTLLVLGKAALHKVLGRHLGMDGDRAREGQLDEAQEQEQEEQNEEGCLLDSVGVWLLALPVL